VSYSASFLGLAGIALVAFGLLWFAVPETLCGEDAKEAAQELTHVPEREALAQ
jgi:predicted MFS family arabinose efflux permease